MKSYPLPAQKFFERNVFFYLSVNYTRKEFAFYYTTKASRYKRKSPTIHHGKSGIEHINLNQFTLLS